MTAKVDTEVKGLLEKGVEDVATVKAVGIVAARDVFGETARNPDKKMVVLELDSGVRVHLPLPQGLEWNGKDWAITDKLKLARSLKNPASKFAAFLRAYGQLPRPGMKVKTTLNEQGFIRLVL
jgi:hypothetical protein